jgi:hypothetical protein
MRNFLIALFSKLYAVEQINEDGIFPVGSIEEAELDTGFWCGSQKERDYLADPNVYCRIMLKLVLKKYDRVELTALNSLIIGTSIWLFEAAVMNIGCR